MAILSLFLMRWCHSRGRPFSRAGSVGTALPNPSRTRGRSELKPDERPPTFQAKMEMKHRSLLPMHDFLVRYALADVSSGDFELYTEVKAANGGYDGYTKPFFKDLKFKAVPDPDKSAL